MTTYDIARRGSLEKTFESTRLFDRFVRLGVGNFGRDSIWKVGGSHSRSGLSRAFQNFFLKKYSQCVVQYPVMQLKLLQNVDKK
jgi:hypothetical protein